jgi:hypothetical protein
MRVSAWARWVAAIKPVLEILGGQVESISRPRELRAIDGAGMAPTQSRGPPSRLSV